MSSTKIIKQFANPKFFDLPLNKIKSKYLSFKYGFLSQNIETINPYIFICNKTTKLDHYFVENYIQSAHVFLKDTVVQKLNNNTLLEKDKQELLKNLKLLKTAMISVVIFPEKNYSIFGDSNFLPLSVTNFLKETSFDIKFLNLVGTYYSYPIWSKEFKRCNCYFNQQKTIKSIELENKSNKEVNELINSSMPSSASIYSKKYNINIRSNKRAEGVEQIIYYCVNCKHLFSVYSEFNCLKCKNCGTAIEFSNSGEILLSNEVGSLDDIKKLQFDALKNIEFTINPIITYNNIKFLSVLYLNSYKVLGDINIEIYADKIKFYKNSYNKEIMFNDLFSIDLDFNNIICLTLLSGEKIAFKGEHKENFYIIIDLFHIIKNNTKN